MNREEKYLKDDEILRVWDLDVRFYTYAGVVHAVSRVSFYVKERETIALVGETGCGKTISTRAITRLIESPGRIEGAPPSSVGGTATWSTSSRSAMRR